MKTTVSLMIAMMIIFASCKKSNTTPQPAATQQQNNNSTAASTTLTTQESQLVAKWYYEKSETITNGTVTANFVYTTTPSFNTIEFKCTVWSPDTASTHPYKNLEKVQDGAVFNGMVWKINDVGILNMNLNGADPKATIDSLTATRLVYTQYTSLQPLNGTRYYLHK